MKLKLAHSVMMLVMAVTTEGGTITGMVQAQGKQGADGGAGGGKYDSRKLKFVERVNYAELRDFVVYVEGPMLVPALEPGPTRTIAQKGATFSPRVMPIMVGTTIEWPNDDEIFHNVFSISEAKPFDLGLYKPPEVKRVTFDKPGRVDVFCSIHANMNCIVFVVNSPYFAKTDEKGNYEINDVPAGSYKITAWHERLPPLTKEITITTNGAMKVDFVMSVTNLPRY